MKIFLTTFWLFLFSFAVHLIIWRLRLPRHQLKTLLFIFGAVLGLWVLGFARHWTGILEVLHIALFYGSLSLCYVITYTAIEADSPTLSLIRFLAEAKTDGRSMEEIRLFMGLRPFVRARLSALTHAGLIQEEGARYVAVSRAPLSFRLILGFRRLYGPISRGG
jgi:hypothetical protein